MSTKIVGIAGGSGSGKTTFATAVAAGYQVDQLQTIPLDSYYLDRGDMPREERGAINYDHPDAFDHALLLEQVRALKEGKAVDQPLYDYATHTRSAETRRIEPSPVIVLEGILILAIDAVVPHLDLKLFVEAEADVRILRRLRRDVADRGRTVESVIDQYLTTVRPMHDAFIEPTRAHADLIVSGEGAFAPSVAVLRAWIDARLV
jgi:uridine kinase